MTDKQDKKIPLIVNKFDVSINNQLSNESSIKDERSIHRSITPDHNLKRIVSTFTKQKLSLVVPPRLVTGQLLESVSPRTEQQELIKLNSLNDIKK